MQHHFLLRVTGKDRPGILAAVTQALYIAGCNLLDASVCGIGGHFALLISFEGPAALTPESVKKSLERLTREMELSADVEPLSVGEAKPAKPKGHLALISVHGKDRPGLIFRLSSALAKLKVNLTDVTTHRMAESRHAPGFVLFFEAEVPRTLSVDELRRKLHVLGKALGLSIGVKHTKA